jgi:hypothetical protein
MKRVSSNRERVKIETTNGQLNELDRGGSGAGGLEALTA